MCVIQQGKINALFWVKFSWISMKRTFSFRLWDHFPSTFYADRLSTKYSPFESIHIFVHVRCFVRYFCSASFMTFRCSHNQQETRISKDTRGACWLLHMLSGAESRPLPRSGLITFEIPSASVDSSTHTQTHTHTRSQSDEIFSKPMWVRGHTSTGNSRCLCCAWIFVW